METVNSMCTSCACLGVDCSGTTNQVWTGCVWKKPNHLMQFTLVKPQTANYTPADLMCQWSKENGAQFYRTEMGSARLCCNGSVWEYDHWKIEKNSDGTERITVYLSKSKIN